MKVNIICLQFAKKEKKDQEYDKVEGAMVNKVMKNAMKQEEKSEEVTFIAIEFDKRRLDGTQEVLQVEIVGNEGWMYGI